MVDVLHPQQERQLGIGDKNPHAYAAISLYKPTLIFELSCVQQITLEQWGKVEHWVRSALVAGIGGKTSTGYGLSSESPYSIEKYNLTIPLLGTGVSSLLRTEIPEFRPNQFKASIRGHVTRLLGGICSDYKAISSQLNYLFGHDKGAGKLSLYWQKSAFIGSLTQGIEKTPVFMGQGKLLVCLPDTEVDWLMSIFRFAYIMAGFGKSWRRVWHKCDLADWHPGFMPSYKTRAIGCHWECSSSDFVDMHNLDDLQVFLAQLYKDTQKIKSKLSSARLNQSQYMTTWREAWHPDNVTVYALETDVSKAIGLFHDETFKYTHAIGGRGIRIKDNQEKKDTRPTSVSSVWHRMLPIGNDKYLEIVTVFRQGNWTHLNEGDMRDRFIQELLDREFKLAWGNETIT
jgi:CRISPR-associated protein Cmr6